MRLVALVGIVLGIYLLAQLRVEVPRTADRVAIAAPPAPATPAIRPKPRPRTARRATARPPPPLPLAPVVEEPVEPDAATARIRFALDGRGSAFPVECPVVDVLDGGEGWLLVEVEPGMCVARGVRWDGALRVSGDEVLVEVAAGEELDVQLPMPRHRTGGIGVRFQPAQGGVRVVEVVPGTPAFRAGLEAGDLIVEVDGVNTSELSATDFVSVMTGEEGTDVSFVVGFDADTGWTEQVVDVTRAYLSG